MWSFLVRNEYNVWIPTAHFVVERENGEIIAEGLIYLTGKPPTLEKLLKFFEIHFMARNYNKPFLFNHNTCLKIA